MWMKFCLLLVYIFLLFIITRVLDAIYWCETGYGASFSRQLLDPMVLSVAKLKALLEQRGVSYEGVIEKSELSILVDNTGEVTSEEAESALDESDKSTDTNFTSGAHFIEQVEDAKDSVWLVQIISHSGHQRMLSYARWKAIRHKASKFGVRTGILDCSLDYKYCHSKGWNSPFLLLALPSQFEKKANVAMYNYSGPVKETAVLHWVHDKLNEKVQQIENPILFHRDWKSFSENQIEPEIRAVMYTKHCSVPMFFSALSVKFPGRVKFGVVCLNSPSEAQPWKDIFSESQSDDLPMYMIYSQEKIYVYGKQPSERFSFDSMEIFLKFLYPCLNDIFILSFCVANIMSWFELFISNCGAFKRVRKLLWCIVKYNIIVIMLWLPIIGIFQMPFLDRVPLLALKFFRILCTSTLGTILRSDFIFLINNPIYIYTSFILYSAVVTILSKKYREEEHDEEWFNFAQMRTLTHLRPNDFFEPMRIGGSDFLGGLEIFGSQLSQPSLWLQPSVSSEYIQYLPTWTYLPKPISERLLENISKIEQALCEKEAVTISSDTGCSTSPAHSNASCEYCKNKHSFTVSCDHRPDSFTDGRNHECQAVDPNSESHTSAEDSHCELTAQEPHPTHTLRQSDASFMETCCCPLQSSPTSFPSFNTDMTVIATGSDLNSASETQVSPPETSSSSSGNGFPLGYLETHQCVICLEEFVAQVVLCGLPCGHVFHETCIIKWLNRDKHFCPMCRWPSYKLTQSNALLAQS